MPLTLIALGGWLVASLAAAAVLGRAISRADRISELHERRAAARAAAEAEALADRPGPAAPGPGRSRHLDDVVHLRLEQHTP